jgi:hypothetical protein
MELRSALNEAKTAKTTVTMEGLRVSDANGNITFTLRVVPVLAPRAEEPQFLVVFETTDHPTSAPRATGVLETAAAEREMAWLRQEAASSKQYMQSVLDSQDACR